MKGPNVFISYRREDEDFVLALQSELGRYLGDKRIFRDVTNIPGGVPFVDALRAALAKATVVIVVISEGWDKLFADVKPDEIDYVSLELTEAHAAGIRIFPLRVKGAEVPQKERLPPDLQFLLTLHMPLVPEDDGRFSEHVRWLVRQIDPSRRSRQIIRALLGVAGVALVGFAGAWYLPFETRRESSSDATTPSAQTALRNPRPHDLQPMAHSASAAAPAAPGGSAKATKSWSQAAPLTVTELYHALDKHMVTPIANKAPPLVHDGLFVQFNFAARQTVDAPIVLQTFELRVAVENRACPPPPFPLGQGTFTSRRFVLTVAGDGSQTMKWRDGDKGYVSKATAGGNLLIAADGTPVPFRRIGSAGAVEPHPTPEEFAGRVLVTKPGFYSMHFVVQYTIEGNDNDSFEWQSKELHVCRR